MDIANVFEDGWRLFVKDVAAWIVGALLVVILSVVTLGILAGPMTGGLYRMAARRVREGRPAEIGDVFSAFDRFWALLGATILLAILITIGLVFFIIPGLLLAGIWFYVLPLIVDQRMGVFDAMSESRRLVGQRGGLALHVGMVLLLGIGSSIVSSVTGGLGTLLTMPLTIAITAVMYFTVRGEEALIGTAVGGPRYLSAEPYPPAPPYGGAQQGWQQPPAQQPVPPAAPAQPTAGTQPPPPAPPQQESWQPPAPPVPPPPEAPAAPQADGPPGAGTTPPEDLEGPQGPSPA